MRSFRRRLEPEITANKELVTRLFDGAPSVAIICQSKVHVERASIELSTCRFPISTVFCKIRLSNATQAFVLNGREDALSCGGSAVWLTSFQGQPGRVVSEVVNGTRMIA